jgi:hypothetical protein
MAAGAVSGNQETDVDAASKCFVDDGSQQRNIFDRRETPQPANGQPGTRRGRLGQAEIRSEVESERGDAELLGWSDGERVSQFLHLLRAEDADAVRDPGERAFDKARHKAGRGGEVAAETVAMVRMDDDGDVRNWKGIRLTPPAWRGWAVRRLGRGDRAPRTALSGGETGHPGRKVTRRGWRR